MEELEQMILPPIPDRPDAFKRGSLLFQLQWSFFFFAKARYICRPPGPHGISEYARL